MGKVAGMACADLENLLAVISGYFIRLTVSYLGEKLFTQFCSSHS